MNRFYPNEYDADLRCEVCFEFVDDCICPECPVCGVTGDPHCYIWHGLDFTPEQLEAREKARFTWYPGDIDWLEEEDNNGW